MLFNSFEFLVFFVVVVFTYFALPHRFRWILLLISSYYFYMSWKLEYILLIVVSTLIDYFAAVQMGKTASKSKRKKYLILSVISNLGILFSFKYFNFINDSLRECFNSFNIFYNVPYFNVLLPVGISFYTFQTLSYTIDVYRGKKEPEKHLGIFALYVSFFPQLVAGPIERSTHLLPQFYERMSFSYKRTTDGLKLMLWGFFKKIVIADNLAYFVNQAYNAPAESSDVSLVVATYFFAFQIFCDFSGYSDIAIGVARIMGFDLMQNFDRPYFSKSISEFWKRWHISLSTWFRDYLYIPLGGNRVNKNRWYFNLFFVFLVSGLWHGANWTFVIWGALHGFYLICGIVLSPLRNILTRFFLLDKFPKIHNVLSVFITFHLVLFAWIFFRANSLNDAFYIVAKMVSLGNTSVTSLFHSLILYKDSLFPHTTDFMICIVAIIFMEIIHLLQSKYSIKNTVKYFPVWLRFCVYLVMLFAIIFFGDYSKNEFMYFQF